MIGVKTQLPPLHESVVQKSRSSHTTGLNLHAPMIQLSEVQSSLSLQRSVVYTQLPLAQVSVVHSSLSSQFNVSHGFRQPGMALCPQSPATHVSTVQMLLSLQL